MPGVGAQRNSPELHAEHPRNTTDSKVGVWGLILAELTVQRIERGDLSLRMGHGVLAGFSVAQEDVLALKHDVK